MAQTVLDRLAAQLAAAQHGAFARWQIAESATPSAIGHRVRSERWIPVSAAAVFLMPGSPRTWKQQLMVAVLAAGPQAVASHRSAAALWEIRGYRPGPLEVVRPRGSHRGGTVGTVREYRSLPGNSIRTVDGIKATAPARTLLDLAAVQTAEQVDKAVDAALSQGLVQLPELYDEVEANARRGRPGIRAFRHILLTRLSGYQPPDSELEARFLEILGSAGLPAPTRQVRVAAGRVDFYFERQGLVVELDSREYHSGWRAQETDRWRDFEAAAEGKRTIRITWGQLVRSPHRVVTLLARALGQPASRS